ncbi:uncharacterized protein LOC111379249 [Olea europaea var. sylvestris]|uniref:uncharacterized protein LOC111379249 n=1 Tax=Olea europaea var. sylvestris TaxID=158386 RepID=UPI000C1D68E1|nr:uncharacterized protein LOC111379249 [Olea europaea var. sylvestris]
MSSQSHPTINGPVTMFSAYGDFSVFSRRLRKGCQSIGVKLVGVPNDAAYKKILGDMFSFALENREPSSILLISGDRDFAPALHVLGQRGYTIILVIPLRVGVSSALSNAMMSDSTFECNDNLVSESMTSTSQSLTCTLDKVSAGALASSDQNDLTRVQRRDLNALRGQLVKLLELSGGCLPLIRLPVVYHKMYGRSLCVFEYGTSKLSRLLKKMDDLMTVQEKLKFIVDLIKE